MGNNSAGDGRQFYKIHLPFSLPQDWKIALPVSSNEFSLSGHACTITQYPTCYAFTVRGFSSETEAVEFANKLWASLLWVGLSLRRGIEFSSSLAPPTIYTPPTPVTEGGAFAEMIKQKGWDALDGCYATDQPCIVPEQLRLVALTPGNVSVGITSPGENLVTALSATLGVGRPERVMREPKLRLALEVYLSSHFEISPSARFLARMNALEYLAPDSSVSAPVQAVVARFQAECRAALSTETDPSVQSELYALASGLNRLRSRSIKSRLRRLVAGSLTPNLGAETAERMAKEVSDLYDLRSRLVHDGVDDRDRVREASNRLDEVVRQVLQSLFRQVAEG